MSERLPPYMGTKPTPGKAAATTVSKTVQPKSGGSKNFNAAFRAARNAGKATFSFGGKSYTTELAKPKTVTETKTATAAPAKKLVTLDRQGQLQPAMGRDARGNRVAANKEPEGAQKGRTYFDRAAPSEARKAEARAYLDRSPAARAEKNAALRRNANIALNVASVVPFVGPAVRLAKGAMAARAVGQAARGSMGAVAKLGRSAGAAEAAAPTATKTVAKKTVATPTAAKTVAKKTVSSGPSAITATPAAARSATSPSKAALRTSTANAGVPRVPASLPPVQKAVLKAPPEGSITHVGSSASLPKTQAVLRSNISKSAAKRNPELAAASKTELKDISTHYGVNRPGKSLSPVQTLGVAKSKGLAVSQATREAAAKQLGSSATKLSPRAALRSSASRPARDAVASKVDPVALRARAAARDVARQGKKS